MVGIGFKGLSAEQERTLLDAVQHYEFTRSLIALGAPESEGTVASILHAATKVHGEQQRDYVTESVTLMEAYKGRTHELRRALPAYERRRVFAAGAGKPISAK